MPSTNGLLAKDITLENESLRVHLLPEQGGRITSIFDKRSGLEFLLQPTPTYDRQGPFDPWERFEHSACAGIDECLPSVGSCGTETSGGPVPDHGDFWRLGWDLSSTPASHSVTMTAAGYSRPLFFEKRLELRDLSLEIHSRIRNTGDTRVPFLYALHPLLAIDPGDRIVLPAEVSTLRVESSRFDRLGLRNTTIFWPKPDTLASPLDLSYTEAVTAATAEMLYTPRLQTGWCGLYRTRNQQGLALHFDPRQLSYLGLWLCYGGWPEHSTRPLQYAVALEPTVAPWGTLAAAIENGQAPVLAALEDIEFTMVLECVGPLPGGYEAFASHCFSTA